MTGSYSLPEKRQEPDDPDRVLAHTIDALHDDWLLLA